MKLTLEKKPEEAKAPVAVPVVATPVPAKVVAAPIPEPVAAPVLAPVVTPVVEAKVETPTESPALAEPRAALSAPPAKVPEVVIPPQHFSEFYLSIKNTTMDKMVEKFLSRPDGLNHLLLSDVNHLMTKINNEFPMITRYYSIGQSTEFRDINVLEINTDF